MKIEKKRRKIVKEKVENWKWKYEKLERGEDFFSPFSLLKMTEICFGSTKMGIFYRGKKKKKHFTPGKKSGKMTLPPQKNMPVMPLENGCDVTACVIDRQD